MRDTLYSLIELVKASQLEVCELEDVVDGERYGACVCTYIVGHVRCTV